MSAAPRVPVTILSGALGVGKTTLLRNLLSQLGDGPTDRRIALLVNEFGEVGIDAALLEGAPGEVTIRELAGGCLCCTLGLPMVVAVTQLLARSRPERLVIEMSGLGHAGGLVDVLSAAPLSEHVVVTRVVTLVDPRAWAAGRLDREPFASQIDAADVLVLHKVDLASGAQLAEARQRAEASWPSKDAVVEATRGGVDLRWLLDHETLVARRASKCGEVSDAGRLRGDTRAHALEHEHEYEHEHEHRHHRGEGSRPSDGQGQGRHAHTHDATRESHSPRRDPRRDGPRGGGEAAFDVHVGRGEGYVTVGAQLPPTHVVEPGPLRAWMDTLPSGGRLKAVLRLGERDASGAVSRSRWVVLQRTDDEVDERDAAWRKDSRLEVLVPASGLADEGEARFVARLRAALQVGVDR